MSEDDQIAQSVRAHGWHSSSASPVGFRKRDGRWRVEHEHHLTPATD